MNRKEVRRRMEAAEKAEAKWDRILFVAVHKVRLYRKRAKYYAAKLAGDGARMAGAVDRVKRRIRIALEEGSE